MDFEEARKFNYACALEIAARLPKLRYIRWFDHSVHLKFDQVKHAWEWSDEVDRATDWLKSSSIGSSADSTQNEAGLGTEAGAPLSDSFRELAATKSRARRTLFTQASLISASETSKVRQGSQSSLDDSREDSGYFD